MPTACFYAFITVSATMDIDATIKGADVNVEAVEHIMTDIVSVPLEDSVTFCIKQISEIRRTMV